jgi:nucleotide-binding universal stress UspA family protein
MTSGEFKTVVAAINFDDSMATVVSFCEWFSRRCGAKLYLVHVQGPEEALSVSPTLKQAQDLDIGDHISKHNQNTLLTAIKEKHPLDEYEVIGLQGELAPTLDQFCRDIGSDLLIIGSRYHPLTASPQHLFHAQSILAASTVPVLITRKIVPNGSHPAQVLLADDLRPETAHLFPFAHNFSAQLRNSQLTHFHCVEAKAWTSEASPLWSISRERATPSDIFEHALKSVEEAMQQRRTAPMRFEPAAVTVFQKILFGEPAATMQQLSACMASDFVICGQHQALHSKPAKGGTLPLQKLLSKANANLIVVPPRDR